MFLILEYFSLSAFAAFFPGDSIGIGFGSFREALVIIFFREIERSILLSLGTAKLPILAIAIGEETLAKCKGCGSMHSCASHKGKSTEKIRKTA